MNCILIDINLSNICLYINIIKRAIQRKKVIRKITFSLADVFVCFQLVLSFVHDMKIKFWRLFGR